MQTVSAFSLPVRQWHHHLAEEFIYLLEYRLGDNICELKFWWDTMLHLAVKCCNCSPTPDTRVSTKIIVNVTKPIRHHRLVTVSCSLMRQSYGESLSSIESDFLCSCRVRRSSVLHVRCSVLVLSTSWRRATIDEHWLSHLFDLLAEQPGRCDSGPARHPSLTWHRVQFIRRCSPSLRQSWFVCPCGVPLDVRRVTAERGSY